MVIGITLFKLNGDPYFSPQFGRGGLAAVFACEVSQMSGTNPTLDLDVEHKNPEDVVFTSAGTFTQITAAGTFTKLVTGLKEQVRLKYVIGGTNASAAAHFNMLAPAWRPY